MSGDYWIRQTHRWLSIIFTIVVASIFIALGMGKHPPQWAYFLPLAPLGLLTLTGLYMFFLPYVTERRSVNTKV